MTETLLSLIFFYFTYRYLKFLLIQFKTGNKNENSKNYWMYTYDFKPEKVRNIFDYESRNYIKKRKYKNFIRFLFYLNIIVLFYIVNNLVTLFLIIMGF